MAPVEFINDVCIPGENFFVSLGSNVPMNNEARLLLLAIAGQESNWTARVQANNGPAHGFWQFERGGGVAGVLNHPASARMALRAAARLIVKPDGTVAPITPMNVWQALAFPQGDPLAFTFARLLLWTDPAPLPALYDEAAAWAYYERNWRPGAPSRERWSRVYPDALAAMEPITI